MPTLKELRQNRIEKLERIREADINPYPAVSKRTHDISEVINGFDKFSKDETVLSLVGRIITIRGHGGSTFFHFQDGTGKFQAYLKKDKLGEKDYKFFISNLDIGDFIELKGGVFLTKKDEKTILVEGYTILSKALLPLPEKWHGLVEDDKRQRFRELEMISNQKVLEKFQRRSMVVKVIRNFMWENGFKEIETPILQNIYGGTYAKPFTTHYNALDFDLFLRIAPELFLKRTVVGGFGKVFEIGKCFRNEGMDSSHLQEFTMFEFYWPYSNYENLMDFTEQMVQEVIEKVYDSNYEVELDGAKINLKPPYPRKAFRELIKEYLKVDFTALDSEDKLDAFIKENNIQVDLKGKAGWAEKIDELYKKTVRPKIIQPIFVTDYPKEFMALAKTKEDDEKTVATFQLLINGWEVTKAYNELNDPVDQKERFEVQERLSKKGSEEAMPYDHDFVESMEYGMPPMAGFGMGIDRFMSIIEGEKNLRDTIIFPTMKPKQ